MSASFLHEVAKLANLNMLSKKQEKLVRSLRLKKNRNAEKLFVIEGTKLIEEAIQEKADIKIVFTTHSWLNNNMIEADIVEIEEKEMKKISALKTAPGVLAILSMPQLTIEENEITLILDDIKDPGNLGTIIRTAETFGVNKIICSKETVDCFNEKVIQASMGSIFRVQLSYMDLENYLKELDPNHIYASSLQGDNIYETKITSPSYIIMGSESHGIKERIYTFAANKIKVPQQGKVESMNVSIATAVILAEFRRRF